MNISWNGACPVPFYDASNFSSTGGYIEGRLCVTVAQLAGDPTCCLPCPATDWTYPDSFITYNKISAWLNVAGFALISFLLISYLVLPAQKTRSHYLSISLIVAVMFINLGFIVPLIDKPDQCYDIITPNDLYSSMTCAWSGAFIVAGGLCGATWIFIRAFSMHLQICWDIVPGRKFFYTSQALGWGVPAALLAATMTVTGVSFRAGGACHVSHPKSMETFWAWLMGIAALGALTQIVTFCYCIHVFVTNFWFTERPASPESEKAHGGGVLPNYSSNSLGKRQTARAMWRRLRSVLFLQWRSILIVTITLVDVIFFCVIFVYEDDLENSVLHNYIKAEPWIICLVESAGDKKACLSLTEGWLIGMPWLAAVLIMLSLISIEIFFLLFRWSLLSGWRDFFWKSIKRKRDFVSLDALPKNQKDGFREQEFGANGVAFEMQSPRDMEKRPISVVVSTPSTLASPTLPTFKPDPLEPSFNSRSAYAMTLPLSPLVQSVIKSPPRNFSRSPRDRLRATSPPPHTSGPYNSSRIPNNDTVRSMGWDPTNPYAESAPPRRSLIVSSCVGFDCPVPPGQAM